MSNELTKKGRVVPIRSGKSGENVAKVTNNWVIALAFIEVLVASAACYLNYLLRYDTNGREDCSMVNWEGVQLPCVLDSAPRPVYNGSDSTTTAVTFELPEWVFFTCAIVVPLSLVIIMEVLKMLFTPDNIKIVTIGKLELYPVLRRIPRYICTFMMGGAVVGTFVSVLKLLIASPRPHFLAVCSPNGKLADDCSSMGSWSPYTGCEGDEDDVHEALRAFPSYHASIASYCGIWTAVYLSSVASIAGVYSPSLVLVGAVLIMASIGMTHSLCIGLSSSNDVIVGGIIGAAAALYVTLVILNGFMERKFKIRVVRQSSIMNTSHPNMMPIVPLQGSNEPREVHFEADLDDEDEFNFPNNGQDPMSFIIPRAISHNQQKQTIVGQPVSLTAQAVNSNVNNNIPQPPPLPSTNFGPPPTYSRTEAASSYNIPRQRFSAPSGTPQAPAYEEPANSNILHAYHSRESDHVPRARTETASYF